MGVHRGTKLRGHMSTYQEAFDFTLHRINITSIKNSKIILRHGSNIIIVDTTDLVAVFSPSFHCAICRYTIFEGWKNHVIMKITP